MTDLIGEVRAMLTLFERSPWNDIHARTALAAVFIAKQGGGANPMAEAPADGALVTAPHVGTVASVLREETRSRQAARCAR